MVDTASDEKAKQQSKAPFIRTMGTHRSYEHLQECYMIGSPDRLNERIEDLRTAGLQYLVLGPVTDDPKQIDLMAKRIVKQFK
jgi:alkanesulfonate monooxygenase SsuD/methylene tetrahydromethanopterin reductase-like flavin-dependent oxidoreductase (luciferase family)